MDRKIVNHSCYSYVVYDLFLGATFVLDFKDTVDLVTNRWVLTLGILVLLFPLRDFIDSMKPVTIGHPLLIQCQE